MHYTTFFGERESLSAVAKRIGISRVTLHDRLFKLGWTEAAAFLTPVAKRTSAILAPHGVCQFCDRRRQHMRDSMARSRKRRANREKREKT